MENDGRGDESQGQGQVAEEGPAQPSSLQAWRMTIPAPGQEVRLAYVCLDLQILFFQTQ